MTALLRTWSGHVKPEWVDYNHHLNDAYYMVIFGSATDGLMDLIGLDDSNRRSSGNTIFTLEIHLNYLKELKLGTAIEVRTQLLESDAKRLHIFHTLHQPGDDTVHATNEQMLLHVALAGPKACPFAPDVAAKVQAIQRAHQDLPWHANAGRSIQMPTPKPIAV